MGRRRKIVIGIVVSALVVGGGSALAVGSTSDPRYRTAEVEVAGVSETLALSGQIAAVTSREVSFQADGTVSEVLVRLGQEVSAGDVLAELDPSDLEAAVSAAQDELARAQQILEDDLEAQAEAAEASSAGDETGSDTAVQGQSSAPEQDQTASSGQNSQTSQSGPETQDTTSPQPAPSATESAAEGADTRPSGVLAAQEALLAQYDASLAAEAAGNEALLNASQLCQAFQNLELELDSPSPEPSAEATAEPEATPEPEVTAEPTATATPEATAEPTTEPEITDEPTQAPSTTEPEPGDDETNPDDPAAVIIQPANYETPRQEGSLSEIQQQLSDCQAALSTVADLQRRTADEQARLSALAQELNHAVTAASSQTDPSSASRDDGSEPAGGSSADTHDDAATPAAESSQAAADQRGATSADGTGSGAADSGDTASGAASVSAGSQPDGSTSGGGSGTGAGSTTERTITAEQILADRAAISLAEAEVTIAEHELTLASLTSPVAGTVVSVDLTPDASADGSITVQADDGYVISSTVSLNRIEKLEVGQLVEVQLPAFGSSYQATVSSIGAVNVSETSTPAYEVEVAVDAAGEELWIGSTARASVHLAENDEALTVPISAVSGLGDSPTVRVLSDGQVTVTPVTVGAVGTERIEIAAGLSAGQSVVLADLDAEIQSSSTSTGAGSSLSDPTGGGPGATGGEAPQRPR